MNNINSNIKNKKIKVINLYNVIFPIWLLWLFPTIIIVILPTNFIIDSLVLLITIYALKIESKKVIYKKTILKIWGFGFLSDIIGTIFILIPLIIDAILDYDSTFARGWYDNMVIPLSVNPFNGILSIIWVLIAVLISGICIYVFNYKFSFKKLDLETSYKKKLALSIAVFTAPYLFLLPTEWFYY